MFGVGDVNRRFGDPHQVGAVVCMADGASDIVLM